MHVIQFYEDLKNVDVDVDVDVEVCMYMLIVVKVKNVRVEVLTDTSVRVSWDNSGFTGNTEFVVFYKQTGNRRRQAEMMKTAPVTDSSVDISDLVSGKEYSFEVVARAVVNGREVDGSRSDASTVTVMTTGSGGRRK